MQASAELSFLNCYICFETLKKPKMCPSCSKVACQKCLRSWVQQKRPQCPHCRKMMPLSSFAECERFISDIKHLVKTMDQNQKTKQKCPEHNIQMTYYCEQCQIAICSDCGMFGMKHKGHKITHLKKIYQVYKNKILNQLTHYDQKIQSYRQNGYQIKVQMQKLVMQIGHRKNFIQQYFVAIIQRLEQEFKEKQDKISAKYDSNSKEIQFLESFRENIYRQLQSSSQNQLITKCDQLVGYIQSVFDKGPQYQAQEHNFDTIHQIVPKYNQFKYILKNYEALDQSIIYSDPYHNNGIEWRLKIYPKGNGQARQNYLSVFLEMSKGYVNGNKYEYKIQLMNQKSPKDSVTREYSSNFDIGQCWGYNQFIPIEQLKQQFLTDDGNIVFRISVRNPSYRSLVRDQQQYVQSLEEKVISFNKSQVSNNSKVVNAVSKSKKSINFRDNSSVPGVTSSKMCEKAEQLSKNTKQKLRKFLLADDERMLQQQLERSQQKHLSLQKISNNKQQSDNNSQEDDVATQMKLQQLEQQIEKKKLKKLTKQKEFRNFKVENSKEEEELEFQEYQSKNDKERKLLKIRELQRQKEKIREKRNKERQPIGSLSMFDPRSRTQLLQSRQQFSNQNSSLSASIDLSDSSSRYLNFNDHN